MHSSGPRAHSSVRSCKAEERLKKLLLPCCCPLQQWSRIADMWVFHFLARLQLRGKQSRDYLPDFCDFERPEHAPRSPPGTQTCPVVNRRPPCVTRGRERERRPTGAGEKRAKCPKERLGVHSNIDYMRKQTTNDTAGRTQCTRTT